MKFAIVIVLMLFSCEHSGKMKYSNYESAAGFNYAEDIYTAFDSVTVNKQFEHE